MFCSREKKFPTGWGFFTQKIILEKIKEMCTLNLKSDEVQGGEPDFPGRGGKVQFERKVWGSKGIPCEK